jgi:signal transduction histidine kinase
MHISVNELQTLIENLLESINIEAGRVFVQLQSASFVKIINDTVKAAKPILKRRSQVVGVQTTTQIPTVKGDPVRLVHVLVN